MKKLKQKYRCMEEWMSGNGETTGCPTETLGHDGQCGFTLVELVIVIAIVIILSVISVPIYRGYVDKSKMAEGYALLGSIVSAQKAYYSQYGNFLRASQSTGGGWTANEQVLGIDARGNKYFTWFHVGVDRKEKYYFGGGTPKPEELCSYRNTELALQYNITKGARIIDYPINWDGSWE